MTRERTRRGFLRLGGAVIAAGATGGLAGCGALGDGGGDGGGSSSTEALNVVPAEVTSVTYADVGGMIESDNVTTLLNTTLDLASEQATEEGRDYEGPEDKEEFLDEMENESGLDPREMDEAIGFGKTPEVADGEAEPVEYAATWFTAGWTEDELVDAVEDDGEGTPLGEPDSEEVPRIYPPEDDVSQTYLGVIAEGEYVVGREDAVEDAIDVSTGDMESVSGDLPDAYGSVQSGLLKAASTVPDDSVPEEGVGGDGVELDAELLQQVDGSGFSMYESGEDVGMEASVSLASEDAATDLRDILRGAIAGIEQAVQEEDLAAEVDALQNSVERDGTTVSMSYENGTETVAELMETIVDEMESVQPTPDEGQFAVGFPL